jgi:hypothetical protein
MLAIGRSHLDWGSADQPPWSPALAALMDCLTPDSQLVLALPTALSTGCAVLLAGLIAREIGCDGRAQGFTAAAQATGVWTTFAGHWLTPYSLEPAQWLLLVGRNLAAVAHLDGVPKPLRRVNPAGRTGSSFLL